MDLEPGNSTGLLNCASTLRYNAAAGCGSVECGRLCAAGATAGVDSCTFLVCLLVPLLIGLSYEWLRFSANATCGKRW